MNDINTQPWQERQPNAEALLLKMWRADATAHHRRQTVMDHYTDHGAWERVCNSCGGSFVADHPARVYCNACHGPKSYTITCKVCGKPFATNMPHASMCSAECRAVHKQRQRKAREQGYVEYGI